jgi:hypothetical protein
LGCCPDITKLTVAQQHLPIDFEPPVNDSEQWISADHFAVEHLAVEPDAWHEFYNHYNQPDYADLFFVRR